MAERPPRVEGGDLRDHKGQSSHEREGRDLEELLLQVRSNQEEVQECLRQSFEVVMTAN